MTAARSAWLRDELDEEALEAASFPPAAPSSVARPQPDPGDPYALAREIRRIAPRPIGFRSASAYLIKHLTTEADALSSFLYSSDIDATNW